MSAEEIANAFITHYYTTLNANPSGLAGLYVSNLEIFTTLVLFIITSICLNLCKATTKHFNIGRKQDSRSRSYSREIYCTFFMNSIHTITFYYCILLRRV